MSRGHVGRRGVIVGDSTQERSYDVVAIRETAGPLRIFFPAAADVLTDHMPHGEGLIAHGLLSGLAARGHSVVACGAVRDFRHPPPYEALAIGRGGPFPSIAPLGYAALAARELRRRGGAHSFDVAHWLFPQGDCILDALPRQLPLVVGPLSLTWPTPKRPLTAGVVLRRLAEPGFRILSDRALRRARRILVSVPEAGAAVGSAGRGRVTVVPFGIDETTYVVSPLPSVRTVLFVGRLDRQKGVRTLLHAFAAVHRAAPDVRLRFAGHGGEEAWIRRRIGELSLGASVEMLGRVPHGEIERLVTECSLLCLPSDGEPFGMAILEAMAAGRAIVATDRGGPRHLVQPEGGVLVAPRDEAALSAALQSVLDDPGRLRAMGAFNRIRVEREFSLTAVLDAIERAYSGAITSASR
jgi:glycosyltransferase involved in cell wall biosynthesis